RHGVRHAKYGFGGYAHPKDGEPEIRRAQRHGLCVMSHSGGTSIPGSSPITHDVLLHLRPDVCGHVNGGTTSLDEAGLDAIVREAPTASLAKDALDAIARGDIPGISCVVIDGRVSVGRSRNTPLAKRLATFTGVSIDGGGHA